MKVLPTAGASSAGWWRFAAAAAGKPRTVPLRQSSANSPACGAGRRGRGTARGSTGDRRRLSHRAALPCPAAQSGRPPSAPCTVRRAGLGRFAGANTSWPSCGRACSQAAAARTTRNASSRAIARAASCSASATASGLAGNISCERSSTRRVATTIQSARRSTGTCVVAAIHRGDELFDESHDRDAAEVDALPFGEIEQQVHRAVEAVQMQHGDRGHARRRVPVDAARVAAVMLSPA